MKKISQIETGGRFLYGGVEWVKLYAGDGTVAISAEPVFKRAFDEDNKNDWRSSSLRRELNGAFLDALVAEGADRAAFLDWESDLTADDGMTDYGTATDKIALLSDKLYRMFRGIIPRVDAWCWNLTPWTCEASHSYYVRYVRSSGAIGLGLRLLRPQRRSPALLSEIRNLGICPPERTTKRKALKSPKRTAHSLFLSQATEF